MNTIQQELSISQRLGGSGYRDCRRREGRDHPRYDLIRVTVAFLVKMTNVEGEHLERSAGGKVKEGFNGLHFFGNKTVHNRNRFLRFV